MAATSEHHDSSEPVLLVHGGTPAARQILMRHLSLIDIGFRLVDVQPRLPMVSSTAEHEAIAFLENFSDRMRGITAKERIVLDHVLKGYTNKAISVQLNLTQRAIELRKASLMKKLNVRSHTELVSRITRYETLKQHLFRRVNSVQPEPSAE